MSYYDERMKDRINSYFAILCITIIGGGAALLIVHIGTTDVIALTVANNEAGYAALKQSILENK